MRYLVLSDIHGNLQALSAILDTVPRRDYDGVVCLGDLIGYGGDPNAVVDQMRDLSPVAIVRGNHDKVALGIEQAKDFNFVAREAAEWTLETLTRSNRSYLSKLERGPALVDDLLEICHGAPQDEDAYIFEHADAEEAVQVMRTPLLMFGHTHIAGAFKYSRKTLERLDEVSELTIDRRAKYLVNPGAVGQPRDGDTRAAYAMVDTTTRSVRLLRVGYRIDEARARINAAGLPDSLAHRLELGR